MKLCLKYSRLFFFRTRCIYPALSELLPTVCSGQLSLLSSAVREMSSSSRATGWMPSALIGAVVCLCAAPQVQSFDIAGNGWPHNAPWYHQLMPISCHFRDCKALLFESREQCYNKYPDLYLFYLYNNWAQLLPVQHIVNDTSACRLATSG